MSSTYPQEQKVYITLKKDAEEYLFETFVVEKDGSFYSVSAREKNRISKPILLQKSGIDTALISLGSVKNTRHPDGRTHTQIHTNQGFKTLKESITFTPPYSVKVDFRLISLNLSGPLEIENYPKFLKRSKKKVTFNFGSIQTESTKDVAFYTASVEKGEDYSKLKEAISYVANKHDLNLTPREWHFHKFEYDLPPLLVIAASN